MQRDIDLDQPVLPPPSDSHLNDIESFLQMFLADLVPEDLSPSGPGRPRVLPALLLWTALLLCVLRRSTSRLAIWRLLTSHGMWHYPRIAVTDQAVYKRLDAAGTRPLQDLFSHVSHLLRHRLAPYADKTLAPFATSVIAIDETTLDPVARILPTLRPLARGDATLLPGKLSSIFDLRLQQWLHIEHQDNPHQNENVAARGLLAHIPLGSLILADLDYFSFAWLTS